MNPLAAAIRDARETTQNLDNLVATHLGSRVFHQGEAQAALSQARLALRGIYYDRLVSSTAKALEAVALLNTLQTTLHSIGDDVVPRAIALGQSSAQRQVQGYAAEMVLPEGFPARAAPDVLALQSGWVGLVASFLEPLRALLLTGADPAILLGDDAHVGGFKPISFTRNAGDWLTLAVSLAYLAWLLGERPRPVPLGKVAVARIDLRTTNCCLQVHGQVVPLTEPFKLVGTPRFADEVQHPPFHWNCRTSMALYMGAFDDGLLEGLRHEAERFLEG